MKTNIPATYREVIEADKMNDEYLIDSKNLKRKKKKGGISLSKHLQSEERIKSSYYSSLSKEKKDSLSSNYGHRYHQSTSRLFKNT